MSEGKYRFNFAWQSPGGHVVRLIEQLKLEPGLILDFGCGFGSVAEPLAERGFKYVGFDIDEESLSDLRGRGFDTYQLDLAHLDSPTDALPELVKDQKVAAVLLLDVLEHIPDTRNFLQSLHSCLEFLKRPLLLLSLPNVAHMDIGRKLAFGLFDYTPTGLLDETHVSLFTERRMLKELGSFGWTQVGSYDFPLHTSDQHFPQDHPALTSATPLSGFLRHWRDRADDNARINQFVRAFTLSDFHPSDTQVEQVSPAVSVITRTQGNRLELLRDAMICLAAQTSDDFDVKLMVHSDDPERLEAVRGLMGEFHPHFSGRVAVIQVRESERAVPLNVGINESAGKLVAFLDDDDMVTDSWIETFIKGAEEAPGHIVRSLCVDQDFEARDDQIDTYAPRSAAKASFAHEFDFAAHLHTNQTPICSFAIPRTLLQAFRLRFDETLPVTEDWDLLMRSAQITGVHTTNEVTSLYRRWTCKDSRTNSNIDPETWNATRTLILNRLDRTPLLLPSKSASRLSNLHGAAVQAAELHAKVLALGDEVAETHGQLDRARQEAAMVLETAEHFRTIAEGHENSRLWRWTFPIRWALYQMRKLLARGNAQ